MTDFKQDLPSRFVGTDEGEVTEYLEYARIYYDNGPRRYKHKDCSMYYVECVLKTFDMWN